MLLWYCEVRREKKTRFWSEKKETISQWFWNSFYILFKLVCMWKSLLNFNKMTTSIKLTDLFSFAWSYTNSRITDYYRHYFSEVVTVTTKSGPVKGYKISSSFDYRYINFVGIPYAKPPVGELRFKVCPPMSITSTIFLHESGTLIPINLFWLNNDAFQ